MKIVRYISLAVSAMLFAALSWGMASAATLTATVDFEGLAAGTIVSSLSSGNGISGDAFPGSIAVMGDNSAQHVTGNAAMIFDTANPTGGDTDLFSTNLGKVMIISEDLNSANPDDNAGGGWLDFNLAGFGPGVFTVSNANVIDLEGAGRIDFFNGATYLTTVNLPTLADGQQAFVPFSVANVTRFRVYIVESGAIDNIELSYYEPDQPGDEGCTPGYWKQPHHFDSWVGYSPNDSYDAIFGTNTGYTLLQALEARGNRNGEAYLRHSTAALLNAASSVNYPYTVTDIINGVYSKDQLEAANEAGCPLN